MSAESKIKFQPKWKELLIGTIDDQEFTIEFTMGLLMIYFPTAGKWETSAPAWAKGKWEQVRTELTVWCEKEKVPLVIEENAWVEFGGA